MIDRPIIVAGLIAAAVKTAWAVLIVLWLASAEPFWHQLVLVLGGAGVTATSVIVAALIAARKTEGVRIELEEHRDTVEPIVTHSPEDRTRKDDDE